MYLAHYSTDGTILGFYMQGMHLNIPKPTLEITEEQHQEYFEKGQNFKVVDNKFVYAEPPALTAEEIKQQKITQLDAEYQPKFTVLAMAWATASMAKNMEIATARETDLKMLQSEYDKKRGEING